MLQSLHVDASSFPMMSFDQSRRLLPIRDQVIIRMIDIACAATLLLILAPVMMIVALLVFANDGGPVIFPHRRLGRGGHTFYCLKFRSMVVNAEARLMEVLANDPEARLCWERDHKLKNDPRITLVGKFLRRTSLDELPQLFNVLRGEMSMVGPRPIYAEEKIQYGRYIEEYFSVRPGLTGLWQISARGTTFRRRVAADVKCVRSYSLGTYLRIAILTVPAILMTRGSY